jgi:hypothetical protein
MDSGYIAIDVGLSGAHLLPDAINEHRDRLVTGAVDHAGFSAADRPITSVLSRWLAPAAGRRALAT